MVTYVYQARFALRVRPAHCGMRLPVPAFQPAGADPFQEVSLGGRPLSCAVTSPRNDTTLLTGIVEVQIPALVPNSEIAATCSSTAGCTRAV